MPRCRWSELPKGVRRAVEDRAGVVLGARVVATGSVSDFVSVLETSDGLIFCKGVRDTNPLGWMHRNEARLNPHLPGSVPRLRWTVEGDGWLLLGFDRAAGRHPEVGVGSADLPPLAATLTTMSRAACPALPIQTAAVRWAGRVAPGLVTGDTLVHTDVTPWNFLIDGDSVAVVDWSMPCRGAAWIDTALMVVRLVRAGHSPAQAEEWAAAVPAWVAADAAALDGFAAAIAGLTRERQRQSSAPHLAELADAASAWSWHRRVRAAC